jgi:hypothetical protein
MGQCEFYRWCQSELGAKNAILEARLTAPDCWRVLRFFASLLVVVVASALSNGWTMSRPGDLIRERTAEPADQPYNRGSCESHDVQDRTTLRPADE